MNYIHRFLISITLTIFSTVSGQNDGPIVETTYGAVQGTDVELSSGTVIQAFLGIPYARTPVGDLRYEPPLEPEVWEEVYQAKEPGNACMQPLFPRPYWSQNSEDCLNLNIYSQKPNGSKVLKPVVVYIHGGSFQYGANFLYTGYFMAEKGVVVVTVDYRLGFMGFAYTGDGAISGNIGLLDQAFALQFVKNNIAVFGGDPNQVTLFGQSVGGGSVGLLQSVEAAQGLFHQAILQSGTEISPFIVSLPRAHPEGYTFQVAASFNCSSGGNTSEMVRCLRQIDAQQLVEAKFECTTGDQACLGFQPVVDGTIITDIPMKLRKEVKFQNVPQLIGFCEEDAFGGLPLRTWDGITKEELEELWMEFITDASALWPNTANSEDIFQAQNWFYTEWPYVNDALINRGLYGEFWTDFNYGAGTDQHAKSSFADMPVYFYIYSYVKENNRSPDWQGAIHGTDVPLLFGEPLLLDNPQALLHSKVPASHLVFNNYTKQDKEFSDFMSTLWTNFATYGNPTPESQPFEWPLFEDGDLRCAYLDIDTAVIRDYRQEQYAYHTHYLNYLIYDIPFLLE